MPNKHVKTINGKKYYYESIRKGNKVTSRYLGPVEEGDEAELTGQEAPEKSAKQQIREEDLVTPEDHYIG